MKAAILVIFFFLDFIVENPDVRRGKIAFEFPSKIMVFFVGFKTKSPKLPYFLRGAILLYFASI